VYLQSRYEVQILDSYNNTTYSNGQAASIYKQHIPMVNSSLKPGEWQTYDIIYGWYTYLDSLGKDNDPGKNFMVENGLLHVKGKYFGYLSTENSFSNYFFKVIFKWGTKQYPPREQGKRDSGILYHFGNNVSDVVWPKSIECQVQEGDCGDYWCVGTMVDSPNKNEMAWGMKHIFRSENLKIQRVNGTPLR
jgi:hypothetical protein